MKNNSVIIGNYIRSPVKWRTKSAARERSGRWRERGRETERERLTHSKEERRKRANTGGVGV